MNLGLQALRLLLSGLEWLGLEWMLSFADCQFHAALVRHYAARVPGRLPENSLGIRSVRFRTD